MLDESGSVGYINFNQQKSVVKDLIRQFSIGQDSTQIGVVTFASSVAIDIHLNDHTDIFSLLHAVDAIVYSGGGTNTHHALSTVIDQSLTITNGDRTTAANIVIVITDGRSALQFNTLQEAERLKSVATVMAVGIGSNVNQAELTGIASSDMYLFHVDNYNRLSAVLTNISTAACDING